MMRAQSMMSYDDLEMEESLKERDDKIRELEEIIARQSDMMEQLKTRLEHNEENVDNGDNFENESIES